MNLPEDSSAVIRRNALSLTFLANDCATDLATFPSMPKSMRRAILLPPASFAADTSCSTTSFVLAAACSFFHAIAFLVNLPNSVLNPSLRATEMDRSLSSSLNFLTPASNSAPGNAPASFNLPSNSSARSPAALASPPVTAVMRRTPLAIPSSFSNTNISASFVLLKWVPPQNSTLYCSHCPSWGFCKISGMGSGETDTTRTGSG
mmetsp:Transcript_19000/g.55150  ORF Transcript_19000/g.55150 Transcript_19000/m.55150 type:complete len:205 (-) Transcript_19000:2188-2802(-)